MQKRIEAYKQICSDDYSERKVTGYIMKLKEYSPETYRHSLAVAGMTGRMGELLGFEKPDILRLSAAGLLHDIGKLLIPDVILHKPDQLTEDEWAVMQNHPENGYCLLQPYITDQEILYAVYQHHERCDRSGYPRGIAGKDISKFAKLVMIADAFDGMTCHRIYRVSPISTNTARNILTASENCYDREYLQMFIHSIASEKIKERGNGLPARI